MSESTKCMATTKKITKDLVYSINWLIIRFRQQNQHTLPEMKTERYIEIADQSVCIALFWLDFR